MAFRKVDWRKRLPPRTAPVRKKRSPRAARKKQRKREQEGSGSHSEFRVKCCLSLMLTPLKRPTPCPVCRASRYHVTYAADPHPSRLKRMRRGGMRGGWFTVKRGYYCAEPPVGVAFRDRAGDVSTSCRRVEQGRTDAAFVERERIRCEFARGIKAQNRA